MDNICFVIMPFGIGFDDLYEKVYVPAIQSQGLSPLRADEIYDNQPIIRDITQSIHHAKVILADVTGRNPNVNYELGIAHALKKEVILLTAEAKDVPSDYRHLRYLQYNRMDVDWNQTLSQELQATLKQVLSRLSHSDKTIPSTAPRQSAVLNVPAEAEDNENWSPEETRAISKAEALGMQLQTASLWLDCMGCRVLLTSQHASLCKLHAAIACLLNERVRALSHDLPKGHTLQMRRMDFGDAAPHTFFVDYLYDASVLPLYTQRELIRHLSTELCTQTFAPQIRYLEEHWDQAPRKEESDPYDSPDHLPQERTPICFRQDFYVADIKRIFYNRFRGDHFYQIDGLLPTSLLKEEPVSGENHWLADWDQKEARCKVGDTVRFKVHKIYDLKDYTHTSNARNISFSQLEVVSNSSEHAL